MGKNLIQQRRGRGTSTFRTASFRFIGKAQHPKLNEKTTGKIIDIIHSAGNSAPLMIVKYNEDYNLNIAPEGLRVGEEVGFGTGSEIKAGNILQLGEIPEGTPVYNIEVIPGDGGKFARTSGAFARVLSKTMNKVLLKLPSKKIKELPSTCLAIVGTAAGAGRPEKPLVKAGTMYHNKKARNKYWPSVSATSMNAVAHAFGGKGSHTKGRPHQASRNAPPGRKVGKIAPRRTGRKNR